MQKKCYNRFKNLLRQNLKFSWLGCKEHSERAQKIFIAMIIRIQGHNWCKIINRILRGQIEEKFINKESHPHTLAFKKYKATRFRKRTNK